MTDETNELQGELNSPDSIADVLSSVFAEDSSDAQASAPSQEGDLTTDSTSAQESAPVSTPSASSVEGQTPAESSTGSAEPASAGAQEPQVPKPVAPAVPSDADIARTSLDTISKLQAQIAEMQKQLLEAQRAQATPKAEAKDEPSETDKVFQKAQPQDFTFNITDKLYSALYSEDATADQRKAALAAFATGIAMTTRDQLMQTFGAWTRQNFDAVPRVVELLANRRSERQSSAEHIKNDFYTKFPDLNKPELAPFIKATIAQVQAETGAKNWDSQFRDLVGTRVKNVLQAYAQIAAPAVPSVPAPTPAATVRPAVPAARDPNSAEEIFATLNTSF